jgi:hypothetical protein
MDALQESLEIQERLDDHRGKAVTLANIGGIRLRRESWPEALQAPRAGQRDPS